MSKFDLRDISDRLTRSRDTEAVVFEFLGYLQALRPDWRASLSFYEVSRDALVHVYERQGPRLARRDITLPVDQLPSRLVRKFFHPSAFFNRTDKRALLSHVFQTSPWYEPDPLEGAALHAITPVANWQACVCLPLADQEDILALLILASEKKGAFSGNAMAHILPVKSLASLALSQHLYRSSRAAATPESGRVATADFQERIRQLNVQSEQLREDNRLKAKKLETLMQQIEALSQDADTDRGELDRVKGALSALEEQSAQATQHLSQAYAELNEAQSRLQGTQRTVQFLKQVFELLSTEHADEEFSRFMVSWFCEEFGVARCSLMVLDAAEETLQIRAQRGIDPGVAEQVKVRVGQGIAGWVAHNRKPLLVRAPEDARETPHTHQDAYNSDSFISVPLVHNNRLSGVLNLSNKSDGDPFDDLDLDRAMLAGSLMALMLEGSEGSGRAAA
ncbi:MAG TPA: GAF domain-containing protein [Candidatus Saccharimonadaceae bacterium]|nr:GAF domain-containing protein [Candidatus Saccharimonadaceae bacterium]